MLDLQKLTIRRLLETQDTDLYSKITSKYFTSSNLIIFGKIENFYRNNLRLPTVEEFALVNKDISLQDYYESQILSDENVNEKVESKFLVSQLQDFSVREETISFLDSFLEDLEDLEKVEIIDKFQTHLLELNMIMPSSEELIDVATLDVIPTAETFVMYPSGLSAEYDSVNGGFALQELVCLGGRRGSGKSIIALNATLNRFLMGHTAAFFSIEMRYLEVYYRTMSIISGIPFLDFMRNKLTSEQRYTAAKVKMETFYKPSDLIDFALSELKVTGDSKKFDERIKAESPEKKDHRFFIIDDPGLTLNRIDYYCNIFTNKHPKFTMATIDYLNIIAAEDARDWKTQIIFADNLKALSRKYNVTAFSPYQIDVGGEARFAKGILDAADRAFTFMPKKIEDDDYDVLSMYTAKIRNGKAITFDIGMDWEIVKVDPARHTSLINRKDGDDPLHGSNFGSGQENESEKDLG